MNGPLAGDGWRIVTRVEDGQEVELLEVDGVEYLHHAGSSREEIEARVEQIRWDHLADQLEEY